MSLPDTSKDTACHYVLRFGLVWQADTNASTKIAASFFREQACRNDCYKPENYNKTPIVFEKGKKY
jgi:hypothetical protein